MHAVPLAAALLILAQAATADPATEMRMLGNCEGCTVRGGDYARSRLMGLDLSNAEISETSFAGASMSFAVLDGARLDGVSFEGTDLRGATFVNARLANVDFAGADLSGAVFEGADLVTGDLMAARLCKTQMPDDAMVNRDCDGN